MNEEKEEVSDELYRERKKTTCGMEFAEFCSRKTEQF
jgi:hypothetical protein